jgi:DNA-binding beta-propeller fold protein YncE
MQPGGRWGVVRSVALAATISALAVAGAAGAPAAAPSAPAGHEWPGTAAAAPARTLYVGHRDSRFVAVFSIGPRGHLTLRDRVPSGAAPIGITFTPDGHTAYVVDAFSNAVTVYRASAGGMLTELRPRVRNGVKGPSGVAVTPDGRTLYVANQNASKIATFAIGANGELSRAARQVSSGSRLPRELALTPDGDLLFASHWSTRAGRPAVVSVFAVRPDRTLRLLRRVRVGVDAAGMVVSPAGRFLYVDAQTTGKLYGFHIGTRGGLRPIPGSPLDAGRQAEGVAITPDGRHVYVTNVTRKGFVWGFRKVAHGRLRPLPGSPFHIPVVGPEGITVTPDGDHLYTANSGSGDVGAFSIGPRGRLTRIGAFPTRGRTPAAFRGVVVRPDQGPVASMTVHTRGVGRASDFDASASSDSDGNVARFGWDFGDGTQVSRSRPHVRHVYATPGTFRVRLRVTDAEGCSARLVFTGQTVMCNGSTAARAVRHVVVTP